MEAIDFELARRRMLERQIRPWDVSDERLLAAMAGTPREEYVPATHRNVAYADMNIPLGHGQVMLAPKLEARLVQALALRPTDKVLEIGTGGGYVTALLAALARQVYSVEIVPELAQDARTKLAAHGVQNVSIEAGDAARGWPAHAPYDAVLVSGSMPLLPDSLRESLAPGGRLVVVVGRAPAMEALRLERLEYGWHEESLFETVVPPLANAPEPPRFQF